MDGKFVVACVLNVNIGCCQACPRNLKKLLLKMDGVHKFDIDVENRKVSVKGRVNLEQLINNIEKKLKKKVEVVDKQNFAAADTIDRNCRDVQLIPVPNNNLMHPGICYPCNNNVICTGSHHRISDGYNNYPIRYALPLQPTQPPPYVYHGPRMLQHASYVGDRLSSPPHSFCCYGRRY